MVEAHILNFRLHFLTLTLFVCFGLAAQMPSDSDSLLREYRKDTTNMEVLSMLAMSYEHSNTEKAKHYAHKLLKAKKGTNSDLLARAYNTIGNCALLEGNLDEAEKNYLLAIENLNNYKSKEGSDLWFGAVYQSALAQIYLNKGKLKESVLLYQDALDVLKNAEFNKELDYHISTSLGGLGDAYNQLGLYDLALTNLLEAQKINEKLNDPISIGITYNSIAAVYDNLNELEQSRKYNLLALNYFEKADYPLAVGTVLLNLAQNEFKAGNTKLAVDYLNRSEKALLDFGTTYNLGEVKLLQAEIAQSNNEITLGIEYLAEAQTLFEDEGNLYGLGRTKFQLGALNYASGNKENAYSNIKEALIIFEDGEFLKDKKLALQKLLEMSILDGKTDYAAQYFNQLKAAESEFLNEERLKAIAAQEVLYETEKKETQIAEQALELEKEKSAKLYAYFGLALFGVLFLGIWFWIRGQNKRRNLETINAVLTFQKSFVQQELEQLNKQLDPHEIKNLLASISPEIQEKAPDAYRKMLKLLKIVKSSLSGKITQDLNEQIQQVRDFLTLEQQSTSNKFDFAIDRNVGELNLEIPRLLLKNLVENALKHGLKTIDYPGKIAVNIESKNDLIQISVEDNGRGRKHLDQVDTGIGTSTYIRLFEVLNMKNEQKASFEIIDLKQGTRVEVNIPVGYRFE